MLSLVLRRPHKTPRLSLGIFLWVFGLYAALRYMAPESSPQALAAYSQRLKSADALLPARTHALGSLLVAEAQVAHAKVWFWRWRAEHAANVAASRVLANDARKVYSAADGAWAARMREAKRELGLWSDAGVSEARTQFWRQYKEGKRFAQRHTVWDVIFAVLNGRTGTDESLINFVLHWVLVVLVNFTTGMVAAVIGFMFQLPGLIWSFGPSLWSGLLFFAVASEGASAVVSSYLGALYGTAGVGTYYALKAAGEQARLQGGAGGRRRGALGGQARAHRD